MSTYGRTITGNNFPAFKQLMVDLHQKSHGKPMQHISEKAADDIALIIEDETGKSITGKTLRAFTNAALENSFEKINPKLYTLHCLAEFVMLGNGSTTKQKENYPHWYYYEKRYFEEHKRMNGNEAMSEGREITLVPPAKDHAATNAVQQPFTRKKFIQSCLIGGFAAGIINALLVIFTPSKISGYYYLRDEELFKLVPFISIANIGGATCLAWLLAFFAWKPKAPLPLKNLSAGEKFLLALLLFVPMVFFKQMASRPTLEEGRNWGNIDFETIAYYLAAVIGSFNLIRLLKSDAFYSLARTAKYAALIALQMVIPAMVFYFIFRFFVENTIWYKFKWPGESFTLFSLNYSHPERMLLIIFISFSSICCMVTAKNYAQHRRLW